MTASRKRYSRRALAAVVLGQTVLSSHWALAQSPSDNLSAVVQFRSDWIYHGTTETLGEPVVGINIEWQTTSSFFVGIEAHRARERGDLQRQRSVMAYIGRGAELGQHWYATVSAQHREFPGSIKQWSFTEFETTFTHTSGWAIALNYSPDYYEHDTKSMGVEVSYSQPLGERSYWYGEAGALDLESDAFVDHRYAQFGVGRSAGSYNFDMSYVWNNRGSEQSFGGEPYSPSKWLFQFTYRIR